MVMIVVGVVGCTTTLYYVIPDEERLPETDFKFDFYSIDPEIAFTRRALTDMDSSQLEYYLTRKDELDPFFEFVPDPNLDYYRLIVIYGSRGANREFVVVPRNIRVNLQHPFSSFSFEGFDYYRPDFDSVITHAQIIIEPIGIPKKHTQDLAIELDLEIHRRSDSSLVW